VRICDGLLRSVLSPDIPHHSVVKASATVTPACTRLRWFSINVGHGIRWALHPDATPQEKKEYYASMKARKYSVTCRLSTVTGWLIVTLGFNIAEADAGNEVAAHMYKQYLEEQKQRRLQRKARTYLPVLKAPHRGLS